MTTTLVRCAWRFAPVLILAAMAIGIPTPAAAQIRCTQTLRECYGEAATRQSVWEMWAAGIDCELGYVECARHAVIGR